MGHHLKSRLCHVCFGKPSPHVVHTNNFKQNEMQYIYISKQEYARTISHVMCITCSACIICFFLFDWCRWVHEEIHVRHQCPGHTMQPFALHPASPQSYGIPRVHTRQKVPRQPPRQCQWKEGRPHPAAGQRKIYIVFTVLYFWMAQFSSCQKVTHAGTYVYSLPTTCVTIVGATKNRENGLYLPAQLHFCKALPFPLWPMLALGSGHIAMAVTCSPP